MPDDVEDGVNVYAATCSVWLCAEFRRHDVPTYDSPVSCAVVDDVELRYLGGSGERGPRMSVRELVQGAMSSLQIAEGMARPLLRSQ